MVDLRPQSCENWTSAAHKPPRVWRFPNSSQSGLRQKKASSLLSTNTVLTGTQLLKPALGWPCDNEPLTQTQFQRDHRSCDI